MVSDPSEGSSKRSFSQSEFTSVIDACAAWNTGVWGRALAVALNKIGLEQIAGRTVLEIGASHYSSLAPVFSFLGAKATASYLHSSPEPFIRQIEERFQLSQAAPVLVLDVSVPYAGPKYDIVIAKSVIGTPELSSEDHVLDQTILNLRRMVAPGGLLLTFDNGKGMWPQLWLKNKLGSGRDGWRYFSQAEYQKRILAKESELMAFGFTSFADFRRPKLQSALATFDRACDWLIPPSRRSVFVGITPVRMPDT